MATITLEPEAVEDPRRPSERRTPAHRRSVDLSRRRFVIAVVTGTVVVAPLVLWALWDLWSGSINPLRAVPYDNFYDLQARAIFHGHLWLPNGKMGIEAFVHNGRDYTYFGLFPSIIRMPILLVTSRLDGQLTGPSILAAWIGTSVFSSLMLWRLRILLRPNTAVGRAEAASYGVLMATIMGGSVLLYLAATPFVYNEDFAWSVPLTVGSLFCLLGVLERPTRGRVIASGVLILCANLDRSPPGWACSIAALLVAGWFALGRGGPSNRRWATPVAASGLIPFVVSCLVTYAKFGIPVGLPMADQVWATVNAHRRQFLAANGGKAFSFGSAPSTLWAYFQPFGVRISTFFPFVTPPGAPAAWLNGAVLDQSYPTASFTDTSPLLLVLGAWGVVTAFRRRTIGQVRLTRIILFGAAAGAGGVVVWGYISQRYLGDFMPFFIIAGGIGLIDIWRRLAKRTRNVRRWALGTISVLALYCVAANLAVTAFPVAQWTPQQDVGFVNAAKTFSLGYLADTVQHGNTLPYWAPAGTIFAMNNCDGLYLSTGNNMKDVPGQQIEHYTWVPVEQSPTFTQTIGFIFSRPADLMTAPVTLMTYGKSRLVLMPAGGDHVRIVVEDTGTTINWPPADGWLIPIKFLHAQYQFLVTTDPNLNSIKVTWYGAGMINHYLAGTGPPVVHVTPLSPGAAAPLVTVVNPPTAGTSNLSLCKSLLNGR